MIASDDGFTFESTGREFYANNNIIGICPTLSISEGYDGRLWELEDITEAEREELADYMIQLWQRFKQPTPDAREE